MNSFLGAPAATGEPNVQFRCKWTEIKVLLIEITESLFALIFPY